MTTNKTAKKQSPKQAAFLFFLKYGACSYEPAKETKRQGYARQARQLAQAERNARQLGYRFVWEDDWTIDHEKEFPDCYKHEGPSTCESCLMIDENDNCVQSLGCIDDASREYRRVIEAELALEQLGTGKGE